MARYSTNQRLHRVLSFLCGMRYGSVSSAMADSGYDEATHAEGCRLLLELTRPSLTIGGGPEPETETLDLLEA